MEQTAYSPPTLREELDRKVHSTLEWLINGADKGQLTDGQVSIGIDTLFMAVAGLVDEDFVHIVTEAQDQLGDYDKPVVRRLFHAPADDEVIAYRWAPGEDKVVVTKRVCGMAVGGSVKELKDSKHGAEFMKMVGDMMERKGWIEL